MKSPLTVTELSNEYAILTVPESRIEQLMRVPQIEYIEKPKRLFFEAANGKRASCILPGTGSTPEAVWGGHSYGSDRQRD